MKDLNLLLNQKLTWTFSNRKITLKSNEEIVLELHEETATRLTFNWDGRNYMIRNEGFWNPRTVVEKEGSQFLVLKREVLGSNGKVEFTNGRKYDYKVSNSPLVTLTFLKERGSEILNYKLDASCKPMTVMNIIDKSINETELLMLMILGCHFFNGIVKENDAADFIVMAAGA